MPMSHRAPGRDVLTPAGGKDILPRPTAGGVNRLLVLVEKLPDIG